MTVGLVRLTVDGKHVPLGDTIRLFQRDPFPGGHKHHLVIEDVRALRIEPTQSPSNEEQQVVLWQLDRLVVLEPEQPAVKALYILNSVDVVRPSGSGLVIEGICSEPVQAQ